MSITAIFISLIIMIVIIFDFIIIRRKGKPESVSAYFIRWGRQVPLIPLVIGILLGHFFWSMKTEDIYKDTICITEEK